MGIGPKRCSRCVTCVAIRASPSMVVQLVGFGIRMGYRVPVPRMHSYGGAPVVLKHEDVNEQTLGASSTLTVYRSDWTLMYLVASAPSQIPLIANPVLGLDGH